MNDGHWRKSRHSSTSNCLEATRSTDVLVRDSKTVSDTGSVLSFHTARWNDFIQSTVRTKLS